jgi:hypothetical protein
MGLETPRRKYYTMNVRWPEVGDLLFQKSNGQSHTGLITKIDPRGKGLGSTSVYVDWAADPPSDYNWTYGYSAVNIHNQFHVFTLVKGNK